MEYIDSITLAGHTLTAERVRIRVTLDAKQSWRHRKMLCRFNQAHVYLVKGDSVELDYEFNVEDLGQLAEHLAQINRLIADPGMAFEAHLKELRCAEYLLVRLVDRIRATQVELKRRNAKRA